MERYTVQQRIQILEFYIQSAKSVTATIRKIKQKFGRNHRISKNTVTNIVNKFYRDGSVCDQPRSGRPRRARSEENIAAVRASAEAAPRTSTRRRAQQLGISRFSLMRILTIDLCLHPYKIQLTQLLKPEDHAKRLAFANWALHQHELDGDFFAKIIFSDEANFELGGYVNKQNCRIWGTQNPHETVERPTKPPKLNVWCGLFSGGVIGPYFFENDEGQTVTTTGPRYQSMIEECLWPELEDVDVDNTWFQQDGASSHSTPENIALLRTKFPGRVISRKGDIDWPPRSCDITPLDFFLWGYLKDRVYTDNPQTLAQLKRNIRRVIGEIPAEMFQNVVGNMARRLASVVESRGGHLNQIIFHT